MKNGAWETRSILDGCSVEPAARVVSAQRRRSSNFARTIAFALLLSTIISQLSTAYAQSYSIDWYRVACGGGMSTGGVYSVSGTIGQPDAGVAMSGGNYTLQGGFWSIIAAVQTPGLPNLTITFVSPNSVKVSWPNTGTYTLQQNSTLGAGAWTTSAYTINSDNGTNSISITPPTGNLFFRLAK